MLSAIDIEPIKKKELTAKHIQQRVIMGEKNILLVSDIPLRRRRGVLEVKFAIIKGKKKWEGWGKSSLSFYTQKGKAMAECLRGALIISNIYDPDVIYPLEERWTYLVPKTDPLSELSPIKKRK